MTTSSSLPVRLGDLTKDNWQQLRALNMAVFPVRYSDKFYADAVQMATSELSEDQKPITKLAFHGDVLVGAVQTKFEQPELNAEKLLNKVMIMYELYHLVILCRLYSIDRVIIDALRTRIVTCNRYYLFGFIQSCLLFIRQVMCFHHLMLLLHVK